MSSLRFRSLGIALACLGPLAANNAAQTARVRLRRVVPCFDVQALARARQRRSRRTALRSPGGRKQVTDRIQPFSIWTGLPMDCNLPTGRATLCPRASQLGQCAVRNLCSQSTTTAEPTVDQELRPRLDRKARATGLVTSSDGASYVRQFWKLVVRVVIGSQSTRKSSELVAPRTRDSGFDALCATDDVISVRVRARARHVPTMSRTAGP